MKQFISKGCCGCLTASVVLFPVLLLVTCLLFWIDEMSGDLGNGFSLEGGDEPAMITYKGCELIPSYEDRYNEQGTEYVTDYKVSDDWIIAKTIREHRHRVQTGPSQTKYYILNKRIDKDIDSDSIRANYVTCYTDSISFVDACKERGVDISW